MSRRPTGRDKARSPASPVRLDLRIGGNGDNWMRLVGLYIAAGTLPETRIDCIVPPLLRELAESVFGDRLAFVEPDDQAVLVYENKGLRDLLRRAAGGERFVIPYHRVVTRDWGSGSAKDWVNIRLFSAFNQLDWLQLPPWSALDVYQGYLEVVSVAALRGLRWDSFVESGSNDYRGIVDRMSGGLPQSPELTVPSELGASVLVYPSGTGHQFMPVQWASTNLPTAYFAFFVGDREQEPFREAGLKVVNFFRQPGDIVELARAARISVSTDSFASHLLQYSVGNAVLALAEFPRERVVAPWFTGTVIDSVAPCSPCPHLERSGFPTCKADRVECLTWESPVYTARLLEAVAA